jgi:hypothetical protein
MSSKTKNNKLSEVTDKKVTEVADKKVTDKKVIDKKVTDKKVTDKKVTETETKSPAKKEVKPATKKPKPEVIVEDVSSDENSDSEIEMSASDSDIEITASDLKKFAKLVEGIDLDDLDDLSELSGGEDEDGDEDEETESTEGNNTAEPVVKEVKQKPTFDGCFTEMDAINKEELKLNSEVNELNKLLDSKVKQLKALQRQRNKLFNLLPKAYEDGCNKARKEKKRRTNASRSGILKESAIPPVLMKFLELKEGTLLSRPKVFSLLNNKFKELGLKKGQDTILDKKTAKLFGLEEGHKIEFKMCQTFLANLYNAEKAKSNEVSL